jgi:hypothetical protein
LSLVLIYCGFWIVVLPSIILAGRIFYGLVEVPDWRKRSATGRHMEKIAAPAARPAMPFK